MYIWFFAQRMNPAAAYDRSLSVSKKMHFFFLMGTLWGDGSMQAFTTAAAERVNKMRVYPKMLKNNFVFIKNCIIYV
jgi:hypothetical protein